MTDKIPIGKYRRYTDLIGDSTDCIEFKFKPGIHIRKGDIITLDMIEPYESEAVRKVADYIQRTFNDHYFNMEHAKKIVALVHEAEDSDE